MRQEDITSMKDSYIKIYGDRWKIMFAKHYWFVYNCKTKQTVEIDLDEERYRRSV